MRESFEQNIENYGETIKGAFKDLSKEAKEKIREEMELALHRGVESAGTSIVAEQKIYNIQKSKIEKLGKFKKFLQSTRGSVAGSQPGFVHAKIEKALPKVSFSEGSGFMTVGLNGSKRPITMGEIMTDYEWGIEYVFDDSVNVHDIRKYYFQRLKADLSDKLDQQIIISELAYEGGDDLKKDAYQKIEEARGHDIEKQGVIAEKMVKNFLKKISIDTDADFEILDADVYQDVEQKVDFIIHRKSHGHVRGANVTESGDRSDIGIQFTTAENKTAQKEGQIRRSKKHLQGIDDLVLVVLPAHNASYLYKKWKENKTSGGPEKMWDKGTQESIFRGVMSKVLAQSEIDDFCRKHFL